MPFNSVLSDPVQLHRLTLEWVILDEGSPRKERGEFVWRVARICRVHSGVSQHLSSCLSTEQICSQTCTGEQHSCCSCLLLWWFLLEIQKSVSDWIPHLYFSHHFSISKVPFAYSNHQSIHLFPASMCSVSQGGHTGFSSGRKELAGHCGSFSPGIHVQVQW